LEAIPPSFYTLSKRLTFHQMKRYCQGKRLPVSHSRLGMSQTVSMPEGHKKCSLCSHAAFLLLQGINVNGDRRSIDILRAGILQRTDLVVTYFQGLFKEVLQAAGCCVEFKKTVST
jgi:hypothetical protein